jgi:hypothetical protein
MFTVLEAGTCRSVVLEIKKIQAPRRMQQDKPTNPKPNFHIPSFKNSKRWVTKLPNGKPLKRPLLITSPEYQEWMAQAVQSLEFQLLSTSPTDSGGTQPERSRLFAMLSLLPVDDSVNDLPEGSWKVVKVPPGEEGCQIVIERLT